MGDTITSIKMEYIYVRGVTTLYCYSKDKFNSNSGWPSFDDTVRGGVKEVIDSDGRRIEIICANCGGHLGHVFRGEQFTPKNTRHCVNSTSLNFEPFEDSDRYSVAYFAGGCFWGVEYWFSKLDGVLGAYSGYMGGYLDNPTYSDVCRGNSGHIETVRLYMMMDYLLYDWVKFFFEIPIQRRLWSGSRILGPHIFSGYSMG